MISLDRLGTAVRRAQEDPAAEARTLAAARARVLGSAARAGSATGRLGGLRAVGLRAVGLGAAGLALAAACALVWWRAPATPPALRYGVDGGTAMLGSGELSAEPREQSVRFSDGSELVLAPHASARIADVDAHGARVEVRGRLRARIHHADLTSWRFDAGPYRVHVIGTAFDLAWEDDRFELEVHEGEVRVEGPALRERPVRGGESLSIPPHEESSEASETPSFDEPAPPELAPAEARTEGHPGARGDGDRAAPTPSEPALEPAVEAPIEAPTPTEVALDLARHHRHEEAMDTLDEAAFTAAVARADAHTLTELGDSARIARASVRARTALLSVRARFPGSPEAARASFILGRLAADEGDAETAARSFERYLAEAPNGTLARDATGRLLEARVALGRDARDLAMQYLERYPDGAHADTARRILE